MCVTDRNNQQMVWDILNFRRGNSPRKPPTELLNLVVTLIFKVSTRTRWNSTMLRHLSSHVLFFNINQIFVVYYRSEYMPRVKIHNERSRCKEFFYNVLYWRELPLWSSGQSSWLQIQRSRVRFPAPPDFLRSSGSGTGSTQPREDNWWATWMEKKHLRV
jgi:hypothetical protein